MSQNTDPIDPTPAPTPASGTDASAQTPKSDPYADKDYISEQIDKCLRADQFSRTFFESNWARNVFFYAGAQWIRKVGGRWERRSLPGWWPRSQTNVLAEKCNDLITQLLTGGRVPIAYTPATDDPADVGTAEVGERIREVMYTEAECDQQAHMLASWMVITGNAFGIPHYDMSEEHGTTQVPFQQCQDCGAQIDPEDIEKPDTPTCPEGGSVNVAPMMGADGKTPVIAHEYPIGAIRIEVAGPFEIRGDHRVGDVRR